MSTTAIPKDPIHEQIAIYNQYMDFKLTNTDIWQSTLFFAGIGLVLSIPLLLLYREEAFHLSGRPISIAAAWMAYGWLAVRGYLR